MAVDNKKSGRQPRGYGARPILGWATRAASVASVYFAPDGVNAVPLVDAITMHDDTDPQLRRTRHNGVINLGHFLQPDVWAVYCESTEVIAMSQSSEGKANFPTTSFVIMNDYPFYVDPLLGKAIKTTSITERIRGDRALPSSRVVESDMDYNI